MASRKCKGIHHRIFQYSYPDGIVCAEVQFVCELLRHDRLSRINFGIFHKRLIEIITNGNLLPVRNTFQGNSRHYFTENNINHNNYCQQPSYRQQHFLFKQRTKYILLPPVNHGNQWHKKRATRRDYHIFLYTTPQKNNGTILRQGIMAKPQRHTQVVTITVVGTIISQI